MCLMLDLVLVDLHVTLAHKTNCAVTALELQEDLHNEAGNLTERCNLQHKLTHIAGDFLHLDLGL